MFKIGEFSRFAKVTIETLRHYDTLGLLKPAQVDRFTGYRYYTARQLFQLNRILALKELGFALDEIAHIIQNDLTTDELRGMLKLQLAAATRERDAAQLRQERLLARLTYLDMEDNMPAYDVILKPGEAMMVAAIREIVPQVEQMPERCRAMFETIADWLLGQKHPFGPPLTTYFNEGYSQENIDTECAFVIPDAAALPTPPHPIVIRQLEAVPELATTVATGDFYQKVGGLTPAYQALAQWIEAHDYQIIGPVRELLYGSPEQGDLTAEIQFPVLKRT